MLTVFGCFSEELIGFLNYTEAFLVVFVLTAGDSQLEVRFSQGPTQVNNQSRAMRIHPEFEFFVSFCLLVTVLLDQDLLELVH